SAQDGSGFGVYGQRYDASGAPVGGETLINTTTAGDQEHPAIVALSGGGYVVTWQSEGQDGSGWGIYGQRYDASGAPVGGEIPLNTTTAGDQVTPTVTALDDGGFVVTWRSSDDGISTGQDVYAQRFDASGAKVGDEMLINSTTAGDQGGPAVSALPG